MARGEPTGAASRLGYQPSLDGWRGIGIVMVMVYHAGLRSHVPGAFLWIDGFFTVSAFLIATLLLEEQSRSGGISLASFWSRRIRRLGPALLLTLVAMAAFARDADRNQLASLPGDVLATLLYVANWRSLASGGDYFAAYVSESPLKHTWSLAIEEQFYVLFPLLLIGIVLLARRFGRSRVSLLAVVAGGGALASAAWMGWLHAGGASISRLYYGTDTRAQALLVGVALAAWRVRILERSGGAEPSTNRRRLIVGAGVVCFVGLFAAQFWLHEDTPLLYAGGFLVAALAQALVFRAAIIPGAFQRGLAWRPLVWVGGLAYGLYLFHFPLFLWLSPERVGTDGPALFVLRFAATFAVAVPVLYLIEKPIRNRRWPKPGSITSRVAWPAAVAAVAAVALLVPVAPLEPSKTDLLALVETSAAGAPGPGAPATPPESAPPGSAGSTRPPARVAVVGDSTGTRLAPGLEAWATATGAAIWTGDAARVGCPLGRGGEMHTAADATGPVNSSCDWSSTSAAGFDGVERPSWPEMVSSWKPDLVVVSFGPWDVADRKVPGDSTWRHPGDPVYDDWLLAQMATAVETLDSGGATVVWLTQPPWEGATRHPPEHLYAPAADPARMARLNELIEMTAATHPDTVRVADFAQWIASTGDDARLRPDGAHLEPETSVEVLNRFLGPRLVEVSRSR